MSTKRPTAMPALAGEAASPTPATKPPSAPAGAEGLPEDAPPATGTEQPVPEGDAPEDDDNAGDAGPVGKPPVIDPLAPVSLRQAAAIVGRPAAEVFSYRVTLDEIIVVTIDGQKIRAVRP